MWFPYSSLDRAARGRRFAVWFGLHTAAALLIGPANQRLVNQHAPHHIVSLELARDLSVAQAIVASWSREQQLFAVFGIGADYLYIFVYGSLIAAGAAWGASVFQALPGATTGTVPGKPWSASLGEWLARGMLLAGLCDAVENYAMLQLFWGTPTQLSVSVAFYTASLKFALVAAGSVYAIVSLVAARTWRRAAK